MPKPVIITTTMSFRSAVAWGVPQLAGQGVRLVRRPDGRYDVSAVSDGLRVGIASKPEDVRQRSGLLRTAETNYPNRARNGRRHIVATRDKRMAERPRRGLALTVA